MHRQVFDPVYGARPLRRAIQSKIENPLAKEILLGNFVTGDEIEVVWHDGEFQFTKIDVGEQRAVA